jgi:UDP-N-acetylmuramoyl-tripeptide--D-alanyl-D-alanine ligase
VRAWSDDRVAAAAGGELLRGARDGDGDGGPVRAVIDSRAVEPGVLFVGLNGERADGGAFAATALRAGAWGVLAAPRWASEAAASAAEGDGAVIAASDPLAALGALARAWRRALGAAVIAITGSVGKTSTKDLTAALIAPHRTVAASRANFNTEIGLPLELLSAPPGTQVLVLELAMRGFGQIAELTAVCEPDVGVITNVGPVHLEQMGSLEGVARAKGELPAGMRDGAVAVVPAGEERLEPWLRPALRVVTFGPGGHVVLDGDAVVAGGERLALEIPFTAAHTRRNLLAAVAAARAVGVRPEGRVEARFSALRGERVLLGTGAVVINDCYNANPLSMRAALDDLATHETAGRRVAVLGDMLELGAEEAEHHREVGRHAARTGVELLVAVGPRAAGLVGAFGGEARAVPDAAAAAALARELVRPGDVVLVKGSRGVGLEVVAAGLVAEAGGSAADGSATEAGG